MRFWIVRIIINAIRQISKWALTCAGVRTKIGRVIKSPYITRNWSSVPCRLKADHDLGLPVFSCQLLHPGIQLTKFGCLFSNTNAFRLISFPHSLNALAQCLALPMSISTTNVFALAFF